MSSPTSINISLVPFKKMSMSLLMELRPDLVTRIIESLRHELRWFWQLFLLGHASRRELDSRDPVFRYKQALLTLSRIARVSRGLYLLATPILYSEMTAGFHHPAHEFHEHIPRMFAFYKSLRWDLDKNAPVMAWRCHLNPAGFVTDLRIRTEFCLLYPGFWDTLDVCSFLEEAGEGSDMARLDAWAVPPTEDSSSAAIRGGRVALSVVELMLHSCENLTRLDLELNPRFSPHIPRDQANGIVPLISFPSLKHLRICIWGMDAGIDRGGDTLMLATATVNGLVLGSAMTLESLEIKHTHYWGRFHLPEFWPRLTSLSIVDSLDYPKRLRPIVDAAPFLRSFRYSILPDRVDQQIVRTYPFLQRLTPSGMLACFFTTLTHGLLVNETLQSISLDFRHKSWNSTPHGYDVISDFRSFKALESVSFDPTCVWRYEPGPLIRVHPTRFGCHEFYFPGHRLEGKSLWRMLPQKHLRSLTLYWFDNTFDELVEAQLWSFFRRWLVSRAVCARDNWEPDFPQLRFIHLHGERVLMSARLVHMTEQFANDPLRPLTLTIRRELKGPIPPPVPWGPSYNVDEGAEEL